MVEPGQVLQLLELLVQPAGRDQVLPASAGQGNSGGVFEQQLAANVQRAQNWLDGQENIDLQQRLMKLTSFWDDDCSEARWSHVLMTLKVMLTLKDVLEEAMSQFRKQQAQSEDRQKALNPDASAPAMSPDTLSFGQQKTLRTALQFILCLGLAPNLQPGVGLPLALRSGFAAALQATDSCQLDVMEKQMRLTYCVRMLLETCQQPVLSSLILTQHLGDLMAALAQLAYAPKPKPSTMTQHGQATQSARKAAGTTISEMAALSNKQTYSGSKDIHCQHGDTLDSTACSTELKNKENHQPAKQQHCSQNSGDFPRESHSSGDFPSECHPSGDHSSSQGHLAKERLVHSSQIKDNRNVTEDGVLSTRMEGDHITTPESAVGGAYMVTKETLLDFKAAEKLEWLLGRVYPPLVVRELLLLQGGPSQSPAAATRVKGSSSVRLPRAPVWLRHVCGRLLSNMLMKPGGVQNILKGMLNNSQGGGNQTAEWRRCDAVAAVIANCPQQVALEDYFRAIGPQICELLLVEDKLLARQFVRVAVTTMGAMLVRHPSLAERHLWGPLTAAFFACQEEKDVFLSAPSQVVVSEERLGAAVATVQCLTTSCEPQSPLWPWLLTTARPMFVVYCCSQDAISNLRTECSAVLQAFLKHGSDAQSLALLQLLALDQPDMEHLITNKTLMSFSAQLELQCGSQGGLEVCTRTPDSGPAHWQSYELRSHCVVELIQNTARTGLAAQFFVKLLQELTSVLTASEVKDVVLPGGIGSNSEKQRSECHRGLLLLHVLGELCETLDYQAFSNTNVILDFVQATLEHSIAILQRCQEDQSAVFENETISLALGLLTAVLGGAMELKSSDRYAMERILPLLERFAEEHPDESIKEMATDLRITIATHGAVKFNDKTERPDKGKNPAKKNKDKSDNKQRVQKPLVEVISETNNADMDKKGQMNLDKTSCESQNTEHTSVKGKEKSVKASFENVKMDAGSVKSDENQIKTSSNLKDKLNDNSASLKSSYQQALSELKDPLLPVRGHALIALRKLIEEKDPETLEQKDFLMEEFRRNLQDEDSYLYLGAVNALSALGEQCPLLVLPVLAAEYSDIKGHQPQTMMKLGEVMVKTSRLLGDTLPAYRDLLLDSCLKATRSADALVRASAMSNLGELCKMLRFSFGNVLHEVVNCVESLLKTDPDVSVRRASAMFSHLLFQGLGADAVQTAPIDMINAKAADDLATSGARASTGMILGASIREVYRLLKHVLVTENDATVCQHVELALEELDTIMRRYLFPPQTLTKTIHVLDPP